MSYAPYPAYKDSGVPWLGQVPEGWETLAIKRVSAIHNGSTPKSGEAEFWDGEILWATPDDLGKSSGKTLSDTKRKITPAGFASCGVHLVPAGSSILSTRAPIGHLAIAGGEMCFNQGCRGLVPSESFDSNFLYYVLLAANEELKIRGQGTTFIELGADQLASLPVVKPSVEEQTAIADFLDKKTAEIDDLIAKKEELLRLLAEQRTALITHAVTKGLAPNAPMKPSGIDWLGDVPEGWDVVPFKWCCQVQSGQVDPKLDDYKSLPLIAPDHIESGTGRLLPYESAEEQGAISGKYQFEAGEVLYSKIRPELSKVALAPEAGLCSADMYAIRAMDGLRPEFLFYQILSRHFHRFAVLESMRVAMPKINRESLGVFPVMVPDEDTQGEILDHIQSELSKMDLAEEKITAARDYLKEYRSAVITNAVTGKIKVA